MITICGTTYQAARTLDLSLQSVINALEKLGINYEVVIVDNYSTDGTYEKLLNWSGKIPMRIYRYRCSRGLGRALCIRLARGDYIFMMDFDRIYNQDALIKLFKCHEVVSKIFDVECPILCRRETFLRINFRDLNRAEDIDNTIRMIKNKVRSISMPLDEHKYVEVRLPQRDNMLISQIVRTFLSENRYVSSINDFLRRSLKNSLDMLIGGAYTLTKFIRENYYVWNRNVKAPLRLILMFIRVIIISLLLTINRFRAVETYEISKHISNHLYIIIYWQLNTSLSGKLLRDICPIKAMSIRELVNNPELVYAWSMIIHERGKYGWQVSNR